jgi:hypothetical protein
MGIVKMSLLFIVKDLVCLAYSLELDIRLFSTIFGDFVRMML